MGGCVSEKAKNYSVKLVSLKVQLFRKINFWSLLWQNMIYKKKLYSTHKFCVDSRYEIISFDVQDKVWKNDFTVGVSKRKIKKKHCLFIFLNAHSLRGFDLSYLNSIKLPYQTLFTADFSAWPWKLSKFLKKKNQHFQSKIGQKGHEFSNQKGHNKWKNFLHEEKIHFLVQLYHYILLTTSVWSLKSMLANFPMV